MIPQKQVGGVEFDGLTGERSEFTIAANGKAFRILIDGLYSNKIQAVTREIWSNAADSHITAGKPELPFHVSVPTTLDPTFRVRDYGVGLVHRDVMDLYTRIFESSKELTNEQTGQLGLGSKSPFAYTDTFSVQAYDGAEKRVYIANIGGNGVPSITHVSTVDSTDPRGLEVSFPVKREDIYTFQREAQWISLGFDVKPVVDGMDLKILKARMSGDNWMIYPANSFGETRARNLIRQGVACYPSQDITVPGLDGAWTTIIDVPIGTADVVASREALSYTPETRAAVRAIVDRVAVEVMETIEVEIAKAKTRREKALAFAEFNGVLSTLRGATTVSLMADPTVMGHNYRYDSASVIRHPGDIVYVGKHYGKDPKRGVKAKSSEEVHLLDNVRLFVDHGDKMVRKGQRIREFCHRSNDFVVRSEMDIDGNEVAASWVVECWELKPEQIFNVTDAPDPGAPAKTGSGNCAPTKKVAEGKYWMLRKNGIVDTVYGTGTGRKDNSGFPSRFLNALTYLERDLWAMVKDIIFVTQLQAERLGLKDSKRYDLCVQKTLVEQVSHLPIDEALAVNALWLTLSGGIQYSLIREEFFSQYGAMTEIQAQEILTKARVAEIDLQSRTIVATIESQIESLTKTFPLLFGRSDRSVFETYIKQVQAAQAEEVAP